MAQQHIAPGTPARRRRQQRAIETMERNWPNYEKKARSMNERDAGSGDKYLSRQRAVLDQTKARSTARY